MKIEIPITTLQRKVLKSLTEVTVLSCGRGTGKTACIAILAIMRMLKGEKVLIVTPTFRQAKRDNFEAITRMLYRTGIKFLINSADLIIKFGRGEIMVISSFGATQETFRGATGISTLIFDEAGSQPHTAYVLSIPTMRDLKGAERKIYIVGTPPYLSDHWMAQAARRDDATVIYGSAHDNPFVEKDYIEMIEREYIGFPDDFKQREIYGKMVFDIDASSMFSEFKIIVGDQKFSGEPIIAGLDIAGKGSDMTVMTIAQGRAILDIKVQKTTNDEMLKSWVAQMHDFWHFDVLRYDATGFGHLLTFPRDIGEIVPVDFGGSGGTRFAKARGLIYHKMARKERIYMNQHLYNKHGGLLEAELRATRFKFNETKLINLVEKEKIKELLGRSPDRADSAALAFSWMAPDKVAENVSVAPVFGQQADFGGIFSMRDPRWAR